MLVSVGLSAGERERELKNKARESFMSSSQASGWYQLKKYQEVSKKITIPYQMPSTSPVLTLQQLSWAPSGRAEAGLSALTAVFHPSHISFALDFPALGISQL